MTSPTALKPSQGPVPYFNLKRQFALFESEVRKEIEEVFESGQFILSPKVQEFEKAFANYLNVSHVVGVASGTDALILAFRALGIGKGDQVILPSYTYTATAFGVIHNGAECVFVDIDPETYTLDPKAVEKAITKKTKAIIPVHLYGQAANMTEIMRLAKKHRLKVVEDAAQAHGAVWEGKKVGTFGDFGCFSFYPTKNMGAYGDGGAVTTASAQLAKKILTLRNLGHVNFQDPHTEIGWTSRLDALQAAVLKVKLKHLDDLNEKRYQIAQRYRKNLGNTPVVFQSEIPEAKCIYHLMTLRVPGGKRDGLKDFLAKQGIVTLVHYKIPVHKQPAIKKISKKNWTLANTDKVSKEILSLPIFPEMTHSEVDQVSNLIKTFFKTKTS